MDQSKKPSSSLAADKPKSTDAMIRETTAYRQLDQCVENIDAYFVKVLANHETDFLSAYLVSCNRV